MKKIINTLLLCFFICNASFAHGIGFNEQKVLKEYYVIKQRVDDNFSKNVFDNALAEDLVLLLHNFDEGYYEKIPNVDSEFEDVVYKNLVVTFANIKNNIDDEYSFFKNDTFLYVEENISWMLKKYLKKEYYPKLIKEIHQVIAVYFAKNYFDDYKVVDMFSKFYFEILMATDMLNEETERMLFNISKNNNNKPNAIINAKTYGEVLYKTPDYYKNYENYN